MMMVDAGPVFAMGMTADGGSPLLQIVPFALILGIFYFIILLPAKRKQQKVQDFLDNLKVNDRVITTGGSTSRTRGMRRTIGHRIRRATAIHAAPVRAPICGISISPARSTRRPLTRCITCTFTLTRCGGLGTL